MNVVAILKQHSRWATVFGLVLFGINGISPAFAQLRVVTTLPDFAQLTDELGGERVVTEALIQGTEDAHYVEPKPSHVLRLNRADLVVLIGLELEIGWMPALLNQSRNPKIQRGAPGYLDASSVIVPKEVPIEADRILGDVHPGGNPHYYTSPLEMRSVAEALSARLIQLDPAGKDFYQQRLEEFRAKFQKKMKEWRLPRRH